MTTDSATIMAFASGHLGDDVATLLLNREKYPGVDMNLAVQQIEGMRQATEKWPSLAASCCFLFPPRLNREQSSSEATAKLKCKIVAPLLPAGATMADLTGGMGIDTLAFSTIAGSSICYVEKEAQLCELMSFNAKATGHSNIAVVNGDSMEWLASRERRFDLIFIDPARRSKIGSKVSAFEDCTPDILENMDLLRSRCDLLMVKASPMVDIDKAVVQLGEVREVHVVALKGECKELLFVCGKRAGEATIVCHNILDNRNTCEETFTLTRSSEASAEVFWSDSVRRYLYEPNAALLKAGAFRSVGERWGLAKLDHNTHLYTSDRLVEDFQGRIFAVIGEVKLRKREIAEAIPEGRAHVVTRNYPVEASSLQKSIGLKEGGELYVVATTVAGRKMGMLCRLAVRG